MSTTGLAFAIAPATVALEAYNRKRDFEKTAEPPGKVPRQRGRHRFVVQEHHASRLHYDLRLEVAGVLKSWAVPKGPSLDPSVKRLAVQTEDHPIKYLTFEGRIQAGNYGAGDMAIWDTGTFEAVGGNALQQLDDGKLTIILNGEKLHGEFHLVRLREENQWLLMKAKDDDAAPEWKLEPVLDGKSTSGSSRKAQKPKKKLSTVAELDPASAPEARKAAMPDAIKPMLATLMAKPPAGDDWLYEIKWDGYRAVTFVDGGNATMLSRNQIPLGPKFPELVESLSQLAAETAIVDGEIVALNTEGKPSFQLLQNRAGLYSKSRRKKQQDESAADTPVVYYAFDLLYLNGHDLRSTPLLQRKELLQSLLDKSTSDPSLQYSDHVQGVDSGQKLLEHARGLGLEGIVAKQSQSTYKEQRSDRWAKVKLVQHMDVVIGGYTAPRNNRAHFGALVVGVYKEGQLHYVGHTGGGFNQKSLKETYELLQPLKTETCPFVEKPATNEKAVWVRPELVCEVKFTEMTQDGSLRHPIFVGLRADKEPSECTLEDQQPKQPPKEDPKKPARSRSKRSSSKKSAGDAEAVEAKDAFARPPLKGNLQLSVDGHIVELTSLDKVYWPEEGHTKGDLLRYYFQISKTLLPYLKDRPLILQRFPNGISCKSFHQHNIENTPEFLETYTQAESGGKIVYALCNNLASLLYLANLGTIAQHSWLSRVQHPDKPDWVVFDLDPGDVDFAAVCELALAVKELLHSAGLKSYPKTSGSSGLHVYVPLEPRYSYDQVTLFADLVAATVQSRRPDLATIERSLRKRPKKSIYLDAMQNREGKSVAAPWSARAKPGATVSMPLTWAQVKQVPNPQEYTIFTVPARMKKRVDPFRGILSKPQSLEEVLPQLEKLASASS